MLSFDKYLWLTNNYMNWAISITHHKGYVRVFHEYATLRYGHKAVNAEQMLEAWGRLEKAVEETIQNAEKTADKMHRFWAKQRAIKWHCRSWKRKGW